MKPQQASARAGLLRIRAGEMGGRPRWGALARDIWHWAAGAATSSPRRPEHLACGQTATIAYSYDRGALGVNPERAAPAPVPPQPLCRPSPCAAPAPAPPQPPVPAVPLRRSRIAVAEVPAVVVISHSTPFHRSGRIGVAKSTKRQRERAIALPEWGFVAQKRRTLRARVWIGDAAAHRAAKCLSNTPSAFLVSSFTAFRSTVPLVGA
jgi:hypothetical protein